MVNIPVFIYIYSTVFLFGDVKPKHELTTHADHVSSQLWSTNIPIAEESLIICKHSARASPGVLSTTMEEGGLFSGEVCQLLEDIHGIDRQKENKRCTRTTQDASNTRQQVGDIPQVHPLDHH